mmetsp:Transcript_63394/g.136365  ORF Transcript_63394/g.136365 Transcript_63394/m.136365 type:complete len:535 (-) Transcript_63394:93-1697(-)
MQRLHKPGSLVHVPVEDEAAGTGVPLGAAYTQESEPLGEGRYSRVYRVVHRKTGARRAVKTAEKLGQKSRVFDIGMECPGRLARHEGNVLRSLDHPNVVRLYEVFEDQRNVHLVLELCEGGDVLERILVSNGRLPESEIAALFMQMLFAVWHLHSHGVVHRDLKPEHFLFSAREPERGKFPPQVAAMKLIDFGLAHWRGSSFTPDGGTPQFMSPEAKTSQVPAGFADRGDMWSLGVVLHAMLVGAFPSPKLTDHTQKQYFSKSSWSWVSRDALDLLGLLLRQGASSRPSASAALKHPWALATVAAGKPVPEPLLKGVTSAVQAYASAPSLQRIALLAVAREVDDVDASDLRRLFQTLLLRCNGNLTRTALLHVAEGRDQDAKLVAVAASLAQAFEGVDAKGSGSVAWTDMLALALGSPGDGSVLPAPRDDACWRAFDFLGQGGGTVSVASLGDVLLKARQSCDATKLNGLVGEVFPGGLVGSSDFVRLVRGQVAKKPGRRPKLGCISKLLRCARIPASEPDSNEGRQVTTISTC